MQSAHRKGWWLPPHALHNVWAAFLLGLQVPYDQMQVQIYMVTVLRKPYSHKILDINICISSLNLHGIQNVNIAKKNIRKIYFLEKTNIFFFCENGLLRTVFLCFLVLSVLFISTFYCPHKA